MLPAHHRLRAAKDFTLTTRSGTKRSRGCVAVSGYRSPGSTDPARVGLAVGKSVGNSVARHGVARRIRGALTGVVADLPDGSMWVVRGLPGAADSPSLADDVRDAISAIQASWA